jgi:hypothetical protein
VGLVYLAEGGEESGLVEQRIVQLVLVRQQTERLDPPSLRRRLERGVARVVRGGVGRLDAPAAHTQREEGTVSSTHTGHTSQ